MKCPGCGGDNVTINMVQQVGRTRKHGKGFGGNLNNAARGSAALYTLGMSNLFWKSSKGTEKMKYKSSKVALCQGCGKDWPVR